MDEEEEKPEKNTVSEEDIVSQVSPFQVPQHHVIIPLSILGCDQQNLEKILQTSSWLGTGQHTYLLMVDQQHHTNVK